MNRIFTGSLLLLLGGSVGCYEHERVYVRRPPPPPPPTAEVVVDAPVVDGPGVEVVQVEPPPAERVYVYDPGYPPGVYFYNNYYWYHGYRYPHDVFINRYVRVNVHDHRYVNVEENRRMARPIEVQHRQEYSVNHGHPPAHGGHPAPHQEGHDHDHY